MNQYVTGAVIKQLREKNHMTQAELAGKLNVSASSDRIQIVKLYPEGNAQARFKISGVREILYFCNRDGLFRTRALRV